MRTLLKIMMQNEAANRAIRDGQLPELFEKTVDRLHPEATYFGTENGYRTAYLVFDLKDPSELPEIAEPLFQTLNAAISVTPVMDWEDLKKGLGKVHKR